MDQKTIYPRVPKRRMSMEDGTTPRICVSQSVYGCLLAVGGYDTGDVLYVHECELVADAIHQPTWEEVGDAYLSGEVWCLVPILLKGNNVIVITDSMVSKYKGMTTVQYAFEEGYEIEEGSYV